MAVRGTADDVVSAPAEDGVVVLHGHRALMQGMRRMARRIEAAGYAVCAPAYPSTTQPLPAIVDAIEPTVHGFAERVPGQVHFVGHSLGGLVIRALLARWRPERLGHVVMLSTPHGGSEWADLIARLGLGQPLLGPVGAHLVTQRPGEAEALLGRIDYPAGVIAGDTPFRRALPGPVARPHDGTVSVAATRCDGLADHIVLPVTHAFMPVNPAVLHQTLAFLENGRFLR